MLTGSWEKEEDKSHYECMQETEQLLETPHKVFLACKGGDEEDLYFSMSLQQFPSHLLFA
jgi:hypothetical protein